MLRTDLQNFHGAKLGLTILAIIAVSCGLIFFGILPQIRAAGATKSEIDKNNQEIGRIQNEIKSYQEAHNTFRQITGSDAVPQIFPLREDMVDLVEGLEKSVTLSGGSHTLTLTDNETQLLPNGKKIEAPAVIEGLGHIQEIPYTIQYEGDWRQTVALLLYLENLPDITHLTTLQLSAESAKSETSEAAINTGNAVTQIEGLLFIKK